MNNRRQDGVIGTYKGDTKKMSDTSPVTGGSDWIGSLITGLSTLTDAGLDYASQQEQLKFEKAQLRYQKRLQALLMEREDSAMQRRVIDLEAAGLSPVLAAGGSGAGSGPVVSTVTPQAPKLQGLGNSAMQALTAMKMKADISATVAQEELLRKQALKTTADTGLTNVTTGQKIIDLKNQKQSGSSSTGIGSTINSIFGFVDKQSQSGVDALSNSMAQDIKANLQKPTETGYYVNKHGMKVKVYGDPKTAPSSGVYQR